MKKGRGDQVLVDESDKVKVPDPSMNEDDEEKIKTEAAEDKDSKESMIEGAWADVLGSGQLKKKVS